MRLGGRVALITGAAMAESAQLLGRGGVAALRDARFDARYVQMEMPCEAEWRAAIENTVSSFGAPHVLVNNAGTADCANLKETSKAGWNQQIDMHAKGVGSGTRAAIQPMRDAVGGSTGNVSSIFAIIGSPSSTAYHAAKGAIRTFTKAAAVQYAPECIRVNSLPP